MSGASPIFFQISMSELSFVDRSYVFANPMGESISVVLGAMHGFMYLELCLGQLLYTPRVEEMD